MAGCEGTDPAMIAPAPAFEALAAQIPAIPVLPDHEDQIGSSGAGRPEKR